jgi:hypothetical protein
MAFRNAPPPYGPLWVLTTWPLVVLAGDNPLGAVVAYKALALTCYVACCALIWCSAEPRQRVRSFVLFAWNPLVVLDVLGKVHNDVLPALAVLLAVVLVTRRRGAAGLTLGVAGALVKASALAVAPVLVVEQMYQRRWWSLGLGLVLASGLAALAYLPFWAGAEVPRAFMHQTGRLIWSPGSLLSVATDGLPGAPWDTAVRGVLLLTCLASWGLVLRRARLDTLPDTAATSACVLLLGLLLATTTFYAHYLLPVVALTALSGNRRLESLVMALSIGGMLAYGCDQLGAAFGATWAGSTTYRVTGSLVTLAPAALVCVRWLHMPGLATAGHPAQRPSVATS